MQRVREALQCFADSGRTPSERIVAKRALAALDEIEATQPKWSAGPPTEEGWYWFIYTPSGEDAPHQPECVRVHTTFGRLLFDSCNLGCTNYNLPVLDFPAQWLRIPAPPTEESPGTTREEVPECWDCGQPITDPAFLPMGCCSDSCLAERVAQDEWAEQLRQEEATDAE